MKLHTLRSQEEECRLIETVSPDKVIVIQQYHYAKRGHEEQGGRGSSRRTDRSSSNDQGAREVTRTNQYGGASASSGSALGLPSSSHHEEGMHPISCSESDDEPMPPASPCSPRNAPENRSADPTPFSDDDDSSDKSSEYSYSPIIVGEVAEDWEIPEDRAYGRVGWIEKKWNACYLRILRIGLQYFKDTFKVFG